MSELTEWIELQKRLEVTTALTGVPPSISFERRRMITPGTTSLAFGGLLWADPQGAIPTFSGTPMALSMLAWLREKREGGTDSPLSTLSSELAGILTLVADRRIEVLDEVSIRMEGTDDAIFLPIHHVLDGRLVSPIEKPETVEPGVRNAIAQICSLSEKERLTLERAISLHYAATLLFDRDIAAAYVLVVAGLETLASHFGHPTTGWSNWESAKEWDLFIESNHLTSSQATSLRAQLMKDRHLRLKQTFRDYVESSLPDVFWDRIWREWTYELDIQTGAWKLDLADGWSETSTIGDRLARDRTALRKSLGRAYDARSGFVHAGRRTIDFVSSLPVGRVELGGLPSFGVLRSILAELILKELSVRSKEYPMPKSWIGPAD